MKKTDLLALFDKQPLETARLSLRSMMETDFPKYLSHSTYAAAAAGSGIEESFKEKSLNYQIRHNRKEGTKCVLFSVFGGP